jgi:autotransporter-associated beta strand protein
MRTPFHHRRLVIAFNAVFVGTLLFPPSMIRAEDCSWGGGTWCYDGTNAENKWKTVSDTNTSMTFPSSLAPDDGSGGFLFSGSTVTVDFTVDGGKTNIPSFVFGGFSTSLDVTNNTVDILKGEVNAVYGGYTSGSGSVAETNIVRISGNTQIAGAVYGGLGQNAKDNLVKITGNDHGTTAGAVIGGGYTTANQSANGNTVEISGKFSITGGVDTNRGGQDKISVLGGFVYFGNTLVVADNNAVFLFGDDAASVNINNSIYGAYSHAARQEGRSSGNSVNITGVHVSGNAYGARSYTSNKNDAHGNTINITGKSTVKKDVVGGEAGSDSATARATGNTVSIAESTVEGNVYGARAYNNYDDRPNIQSVITGNTVNLSGGAEIKGDVRGGDYYGTKRTLKTDPGKDDFFTGNKLNIGGIGNSAAGIYEIQYLHFTLPGNMNKDDIMLTVGGNGLHYGNNTYNAGTSYVNTFTGQETNLDIRTPGSYALDSNLEGSYTLLSNSTAQQWEDIKKYTLHGAEFVPDNGQIDGSTQYLSVTLGDSDGPGSTKSSRVRGDFTLSLEMSAASVANANMVLEVTNYFADNTTVTWTGNDQNNATLWVNFSVRAESPENWEGWISYDETSETRITQYLDGDKVIFRDAGSGTIQIHEDGVSPQSMTVDSSNGYTFSGGGITTQELIKDGDGLLTLDNTLEIRDNDNSVLADRRTINAIDHTVIRGGLVNFSDAKRNFGLFPNKNRITLDGGGLQWASGNTEDISDRLNPIGPNGGRIDTNGNDVTLSTALSGDGGLTKIGLGTLTLDETGTYDGDTAIEAGTLRGSIPENTNLTIDEDAIYDGADSNGTPQARIVGRLDGEAGASIINTAGLTVRSGDFAGVIDATNTGGLIKEGTDDVLTLTGANSYASGTVIRSGVIVAGHDSALGTGEVTMHNGTSLGFLGDHTLPNDFTLNHGNATFDTSSYQATLSGTVGGNGGLIKAGTGTLILDKTGTYGGPTEVRGGTLEMENGMASRSLILYNDTRFTGGTVAPVALDRLTVYGNTYGGAYAPDTPAHIDSFVSSGTATFHVPATMPADVEKSVLLDVDDEANLEKGTRIDLRIDPEHAPIGVGKGFTLLEASTLIVDGDIDHTVAEVQSELLEYTVEFFTTPTLDPRLAGLSLPDNRLVALITGVGFSEEGEVVIDSRQTAFVPIIQGVDLAVDRGIAALLDTRAPRGRKIFAVLDGGSLRYNTGSRVEVDSLDLIAGIVGDTRIGNRPLTLGAFVIHGEGNYDAGNTISSSWIKSRGDTEYTGVGLLARLDLSPSAKAEKGATSYYLEGSFQAGRAENTFRGGNLQPGRVAKYDTASPYVGMHLGAGRVWNPSDETRIDFYGKYLYARRGGDKFHLSTGGAVNPPMEFFAVESHRLRVGGRFHWTVGTLSPYVGLAVEHEFDGRSKVKLHGLSADAPSLEGTTTLLEFGATLRPTPTSPLSFEFGAKGTNGKRSGVTGNLRIKYEF